MPHTVSVPSTSQRRGWAVFSRLLPAPAAAPAVVTVPAAPVPVTMPAADDDRPGGHDDAGRGNRDADTDAGLWIAIAATDRNRNAPTDTQAHDAGQHRGTGPTTKRSGPRHVSVTSTS